ncbi:MAG: hypothetical protein ABIB41_03935 [Nitrospirota bacterium]
MEKNSPCLHFTVSPRQEEGNNMGFEEMLRKYFDKVLTEVDFVKKTYTALEKFGFNDENAIASVCICRDEISQSLRSIIKHVWGEAFNLSSLAAMFTAGKTGLLAAMHHAPRIDDRERYVFYVIPHIAIDEEGRIGFCSRKGIKESTACGALNIFLKELGSNNPPTPNDKSPLPPFTKGGLGGITEKGGKGKGGLKRSAYKIDNDDIEMSLIRMRLLKELPYGHIPDLLELTKITRKAIQTDLENALSKIVNTKKSDYALITGIQINAPDGNYIWPAECYAFVNGIKKDVTL